MKPPLAWLLAGITVLSVSNSALAQRVKETDLVSDIPGRAAITDPNLVNVWGLVPGSSGVFWASNGGSGTSTLYQPDGTKLPLVVHIPGGSNTGVVLTSAGDSAFVIPSADTSARAIFIFVTENGTIAAWSNTLDPANAIQVASTPEAIYKGVAVANTTLGPRLYAANFHAGTIDVFDRFFRPVTLPAGRFADPTLPPGYAPFNVTYINGQLYVAYAKQDATAHDDVAGAGFGFISVYDKTGHFLRRFASNGPLDAPWGMVVAPAGFGPFGGALLVGNFGDGMINVFWPATGAFAGALEDSLGNPLHIEGLWGLNFGRAASGPAVAGRLYFAAGIADETHGLFGYLTPTAGPPSVVCDNRSRSREFWEKQCTTSRNRHDDDDDRNSRGGGDDRNGRGSGDDDHHRGAPGRISADSLRTLFECIASTSPAFGPQGCFTAGCDLLRNHDASRRDRVAQLYLALQLDRCAGLACDTTVLSCKGGDLGDGVAGHTLGEIVALLDSSLCHPGGSRSWSALERVAACALRSTQGGHDDDEDDDDDRAAAARADGGTHAQLEVASLGGNPVRLASGLGARFVLSSAKAATVRFSVYDAAGRLVAEPLRDVPVSGQVTVHWDGLNLHGRPAPSGAYFYRAIAGDAVASGRIVVVR